MDCANMPEHAPESWEEDSFLMLQHEATSARAYSAFEYCVS